uniref:Uncharacterized protein n=1 Tax=Terrapene triunguis TaxID=2587831 RepID=A0A674JB08_9SAUR
MAARGREKEPPDLVHQNQIFCETVRKELRCQKLHTEYGVNPLKRGKVGRKGPTPQTEGDWTGEYKYPLRRGRGESRGPPLQTGRDGRGRQGGKI